jgi:hypothetical protein
MEIRRTNHHHQHGSVRERRATTALAAQRRPNNVPEGRSMIALVSGVSRGVVVVIFVELFPRFDSPP